MGDIKLYQHRNGQQRGNDLYYVLHRSIAHSLDDLISEGLAMYEAKIFYFALTIIGIPAYIYAWFLDINSDAELWKGIVLTAIGAGTGLVILCRQYIKLRREWKEFKNDYKKKESKEG